jgi:RNA 3'-phosphate cyclase
MITLDGSYGEGGGALVRTAVALSALTGKSFEITNIRAGRFKSGLKAQHLHAIKLMKQFCQAKTNPIEIGSTMLRFVPGEVKRGIYEADIGTAGSISLLLQAAILPALFAPGKVTFKITGGTCGKWQAPVEYIKHVVLPQLNRFVDKIEMKILKRGYYPSGGGVVQLEITPRLPFDSNEIPFKVAKIMLTEQGELEHIGGTVDLSLELEERKIGERISSAIKAGLKEYDAPCNINVEYAKTRSIGGEAVVWAVFSEKGKVSYDNPVILGGDALVDRSVNSEEVGKKAADMLKKEIQSGAACDRYLADQVVPFMALLPGSEIVTSEITKHTETNMYVIEKFLDVGFTVEGKKITVMKK